MKVSTKVKIEVVTKEETTELTDEELKLEIERMKKDVIDILSLEESIISSYDINISIEKEN